MARDALASPQVCPAAGSVGSSVWHIRRLSGGTFCPDGSLHRHSLLRAELRLPFPHPLRAHVGRVALWALGFLSNWGGVDSVLHLTLVRAAGSHWQRCLQGWAQSW